MYQDIKNKIVVVTGAAIGIGFEIANEFLNKEAKVAVVLDINEKLGVIAEDKLKSIHGRDKVEFYKCDVTTDLNDVSKKILDKYNTVDILVNNAGVCGENRLKLVIDVNVTATLEWALKFYEHMRKDKGGNGGTIINIGSTYSYKIDPLTPVYRSSKFAIRGFTRTLGHEYHFNKTGVRVVSVCPGYTDTTMGQCFDPNDEYVKDIEKFMSHAVLQKATSVGRAVTEVFEKAESGSIWEIENDGPVTEIAENPDHYINKIES